MNFFKLLLIGLASLSATANTKSISCETYYQVDWDMPVEIKITADITRNEEGSYTLDNRTLSLRMDHGTDYSWYSFTGSSQVSISNDENYRPRKYKGFAKFYIDSEMEGYEDERPAPHGLFGSLDFLIPMKELDNTESGDEFNAVTIMSYIADHWGGSRTLKCIVK